MKIISLSDTHGMHQRVTVPWGDVLIYCGDYTSHQSFQELQAFNDWMSELPHKHKLFVAGNHDLCFEKQPCLAKETLSSCTVLHNESVTIEEVTFYGSSIQPVFCNWAFNIPDDKRKAYWDAMPDGIDVLITHCPPHGILDEVRSIYWGGTGEQVITENVGDKLLADRVKEIEPKMHFFGHIHSARGVKDTFKSTDTGLEVSTIFINCSVLDDRYDLKFEPITINL